MAALPLNNQAGSTEYLPPVGAGGDDCGVEPWGMSVFRAQSNQSRASDRGRRDSGYLVEELNFVRWPVGERLGLLGRKLQAPSDRPGSGKVGDELSRTGNDCDRCVFGSQVRQGDGCGCSGRTPIPARALIVPGNRLEAYAGIRGILEGANGRRFLKAFRSYHRGIFSLVRE